MIIVCKSNCEHPNKRSWFLSAIRATQVWTHLSDVSTRLMLYEGLAACNRVMSVLLYTGKRDTNTEFLVMFSSFKTSLLWVQNYLLDNKMVTTLTLTLHPKTTKRYEIIYENMYRNNHAMRLYHVSNPTQLA